MARLEAKIEATLRGEIGGLWWKIAALLVTQIAALVAIIELRLRLP